MSNERVEYSEAWGEPRGDLGPVDDASELLNELQVQYGYSTPTGTLNASRLTSMTYPNGRTITYDYGTGIDDAISRLVAIKDGSTTLESYTYLAWPR